MTTKQGCYFYAIKRVSDNTYYSYIYKDFMNLRQDTRLYKPLEFVKANLNNV